MKWALIVLGVNTMITVVTLIYACAAGLVESLQIGATWAVTLFFIGVLVFNLLGMAMLLKESQERKT